MKTRQGFVSNSSSSSFICDVAMTPQAVEAELHKMLDAYNETHGYGLLFEDVFSTPYIATESTHEGWQEYYPQLGKSSGKIVIDSVEDNSIPYDLFDEIERKFKATRSHLG